MAASLQQDSISFFPAPKAGLRMFLNAFLALGETRHQSANPADPYAMTVVRISLSQLNLMRNFQHPINLLLLKYFILNFTICISL